MQYAISHISKYKYSDPVSLSHNEIYLSFSDNARQQCLSSDIVISPDPSFISRRKDFFGNLFSVFTIEDHHLELNISAKSRIRIFPRGLPDFSLTPPWESVATRLRFPKTSDAIFASQFLFDSPFVKTFGEARAFTLESFPPGRPLLEGVRDLTRRIHSDSVYEPNATTVSTPVQEFFRSRRGVCQDFAHLEIACLRSIGLAARYVSGYLETTPPPGQEKLVGADASHAWIAVFVPDIGWIDVDPTNDLFPMDRHLTLAWGRDYGDVTPIKGIVLGGGKHEISVSVDVLRD